jgi:DNA-directed RNA polymerase subunit M/transcription elongation factor TFIIS
LKLKIALERRENMGRRSTTGRCPKCGGNLYLDRDYNGWYEQCLQCAYIKDLAVVYQRKKKTEKEGQGKVQVKAEKSLNKKDVAPDK